MPTKIMVVDDNYDIRNLLATWLKQVGYEVTEVEDGQKAIEAFNRERPHLIFLDMLLPKVNGIDVCRTIKSVPGARDIPIVMMTAVYKGIQFAIEAKKSGADHFIEKPFENDKILRLTHSLIGPPQIDLVEDAAPEEHYSEDTIELEGNLTDASFAEIITSIHRKKMTGELILESGSSKKTVYFKEGRSLFTSSNQIGDRLGITLLKEGLITKEQYDEAVRLMQQSNGSLKIGESLIKLGYITDYELAYTLREQYRKTILSLFQWMEGEYKFVHVEKDRKGSDLLNIDVTEIVYEGITENYTLSRVEKELKDLNTVFILSKEGAEIIQRGNGTPEEKRYLSLIDGLKSLQDFIEQNPEKGEETVTFLYSMYLNRYLLIKGVKDALSAERSEGTSHVITPEMIRKKVEEIKDQNYYQILGIPSTTDTNDIKKAYFRLAKLYHPDKFVSKEYESLRSAIATIFNKISEAHKVLTSYSRRMEYEKSMSTETEDRETVQRFAKVRNAELRYIEAKAAYQRSQYKEAIEALKWAINLNPDESDYHRLMAMAIINNYLPTSAEYREAEIHLKKAIDFRADHPENYYWYGIYKKKLGFVDQAYKDFKKAVELKKDYHESLREVRLYELRLEKNGKKGGIFGKKKK